MSQFSFLTIEIVGMDIAITLILLLGVRRALLDAGRTASLRAVATLSVVFFGWLAVALFLASQGVFRGAAKQPVPYIGLAIGVPVAVGALCIRGSKQVREMIAAVPQNWLVAFQFYRVVGVTFLILHAMGQLPGIFALPAGYGDLFVGLTALLVGFAYARNHAKRDQFVMLWNWFGIADLVVAVATGFLSSPGAAQLFSLNAPNVLIGSFPLVMVPIYAVPLSFVLHIASLTKVREARAASSGNAANAAIAENAGN
jgi:hypothetical protein